MVTDSAVQEAPLRRRSRDGCFTCKTRKVQCTKVVTESESEVEQTGSSKCATCVRLGLECRWHAPAPGEHYIPPPKRRRTVAQRSSPAPKNHPKPASYIDPENLVNADTSNLDRSMNSQLENLGVLDLGLSKDAEIPIGNFTGAYANILVEEEKSVDLDSETPITINNENSRLVQHYLDVMKGYAKLDEFPHKASNLFVSAFSRSLQFPPLFYAILAFSASHLSVEDESYSRQTSRYTSLADSSFQNHNQGEDTDIDALLSALVVRIKTVHMMGGEVETFHSIMKVAADIVSSERDAQALEDPSSSSRRIIIRLAILDARASYFRLGGGILVRRLCTLPSCSFIIEREPDNASSRTTLLNLLQADMFKVRVADLDIRLHGELTGDSDQSCLGIQEFNGLYKEICHEIGIIEKRMVTFGDDLTRPPSPGDRPIDPASYDRLIVLSALHSGLLYLTTIIPFPLDGCEKSVSRILLTQLKVSHDPSRRGSPGSLMPASLFLAGVHNRNPIKSDWILGLLDKGMEWGPYIGKTRLLLDSVLQAQSKGIKINLRDIMDQATGRFVI